MDCTTSDGFLLFSDFFLGVKWYSVHRMDMWLSILYRVSLSVSLSGTHCGRFYSDARSGTLSFMIGTWRSTPLHCFHYLGQLQFQDQMCWGYRSSTCHVCFQTILIFIVISCKMQISVCMHISTWSGPPNMKNFRGMYVVRHCAAACIAQFCIHFWKTFFSESSYSAPQVLKVDFRHTTWHSVSHRVGKVERKICGGGGIPNVILFLIFKIRWLF